MALTRTAAVLTTMLRNRADHKVGAFRSDAELYQYLSDSCRSLVNTLVDSYGETYWGKYGDIFTSADQNNSGLPTDFWKLLAMRVTIGSTRRRIPRADMDDIDVEAVSVGGWSEGRWPKHRILGSDTVYWAPVPRSNAHAVRLYYVPTTIFKNSINVALDDMAASTDKFDGIFGWDAWVVLDAAIKLLSDEKKDTSVLAAERDMRMSEIRVAAQNQGADDAPKVRDRYGDDDDDDWPNRMPPGGYY